ncbi:MAG: VOC family protein [Solitalea sp.]
MLKMHPYLNFDGQAEEAFKFYKSVLGGEFSIFRMGDMPGGEELSESERQRTMHISLPIGDHVILMASDTLPSLGHKLTEGNNFSISLHPGSREEADRLFQGLSEGGEVDMPMEDQFWGDYFGSFKDKFGIHWMINYNPE